MQDITLHLSRLAHDPSNLARHNYSSYRFSFPSGSGESVLAPLEGARQISPGGYILIVFLYIHVSLADILELALH